jgi:glycosyltransferase involved in cell wall biosynthesis
MIRHRRRAAHFLLSWKLAESPPNEALIRACHEAGLSVDLYAPGDGRFTHSYGESTRTFSVEYGFRWLARNAWKPAWRRYALICGTAEDPLAVVRVLAALHRKPSVAIVDEIKSGSYRGDARESWKRLCRSGIRNASTIVVNDRSRIDLVRQYAGVSTSRDILVYPSGFVDPPLPRDRRGLRTAWGVPEDSLLVGFSGGCNLTAGVDWLLEAVEAMPNLHTVLQPLGVDPFAQYLLNRLRVGDRVRVDTRSLSWRDYWAEAAAFDIGVAVYLNPAPQFQHMGTSSNRLCMFLAMGVPVIASRQDSFRFLEQYHSGVLVDDAASFAAAVTRIAADLEPMKRNATLCWREHVAAVRRYEGLLGAIRDIAANRHRGLG